MFKKETYLNTVMNIETKMHLKQMRISAHKLAIEQGRYWKIDKDKIICKKDGLIIGLINYS